MRMPAVKQIALACCTIAMLFVNAPSRADDEVVNFAGQDPTEEDIRAALTPRPVLKTRAISPGAVAGAGGAAAATLVAPPKVSFDQIAFELNSDRINPRAQATLDKLGHTLSSGQLGSLEFLIEGHTDATGSVGYNMRLSKRRAESVKRYLVDNHAIQPNRLRTAGKGPTDLLDKDNPESGANRRVVFVTEERK